MLCSIKDREELEKLNKLVSLQNQVQEVRLQDKLGKQNYQYESKELIKPVNKSIQDSSKDIKRAITESSVKNNEALEILNNKLLEILNESGIIASCLLSPLSKITTPENTTQFTLIKVSNKNSNGVNDSLIHNNIPDYITIC